MKYVQRKTKNLSAKKRKKIKSFIEPVNCPVTWIFCSRKSNNKINRLHERSLGIFNNDYESTYEELLSNSNYFSFHDQNIHRLATEKYKVDNNLSVGDFKSLFDFKDQYALHIHLVNTDFKFKNSIRYFVAVVSNAIPINIKYPCIRVSVPPL